MAYNEGIGASMDAAAPFGPRFEIRRRLGEGGFGVVYAALDRERGHEVALKSLRRFDPSALYKFKQEFRALCDISHPNLVSLHELFSQGERWFYTMELVAGRDALRFVRGGARSGDSPTWDADRALASTRVAPGPGTDAFRQEPTALRQELPAAHQEQGRDLTWESREPVTGPSPGASSALARSAPHASPGASSALARSAPHASPGTSSAVAFDGPAAEWPGAVDEARLRAALQQLAEGLCFLHDAGKLHRDIKPSNMLVSDEGRLVLLDFGLVRELAEGSGQSGDAVVGTPGYMSPEQAGTRGVGPPSDWYSVGVFLYEALTGRLPFDGNWLQVLAQQRHHRPPPPSSLVRGVPRDLEALCLDLLSPSSLDRPTGRQVLRRVSGPGRRAQTPSTPPVLYGPARGDLVGRAAELAALQRAAAEAHEGGGLTLLLRGSPGTGKSALLRAFAERSGAVVLAGRCYQQETVPYKALDGVVDALSRLLARLPRHEAQALLPAEAPALTRLFPVLQQVEAVARAPRPAELRDAADQQELRRRAFSALRELLARLADRRTLVLLIDDLQWGDEDSAALLGQLMAPPDAPALLLCLAYRSEDAEGGCVAALRRVLPAPTADGPVRELALGPLPPAEATELAARILAERLGPEHPAPPGHAAAIGAESGGLPSVIEELAGYQAASLSGEEEARADGSRVSLEEMIGSRIRRLPEPAQRLLQLVATAGRPLPRQLAGRAAGLGAEEPQIVAQLRGGRLLRLRTQRAEEELEPYHNRVGEAVLHLLGPEERREAHLQLARAIEAAGGDAEALVLHYEAGGEPEAAGRHAARAATQAEEALAFERAARLYRVALRHAQDEAEAQRLRVRLAEALRNAGRGPEAARAYLEAAEAAPRGDGPGRSASAAGPAGAGSPGPSPTLRPSGPTFGALAPGEVVSMHRPSLGGPPGAMELRRRAAEQLLHSGHLAEGLEVLGALLRQVGLRLPGRPLWALVRLLFLRAYLWLRGLRAAERPAAAVPPAELLRVDTCWAVASGLANKDTIRGAYFGTLHLLYALRAGEPGRLLRAFGLEVSYAALAGGPRPGRLERLAQAALLELAGRTTDPYAQGVVPLYGGVAALLRGRWQEALSELDRAGEIFRERTSGTAWEQDSALHFSLLCLGALGRLRELRRRLPAALQDARQRGDRYAEVTVRVRVGHLPPLVDDRPEDAEREVREALGAWSAPGFHLQHYFGLVSLSEIALYAERGAGEAALRLVRAQWPALRGAYLLHAQSIRGDALALQARALVAAAAAARSPGPQAALLQEAERVARALRRERMGWISAKADLVLAAAMAMRGRRDRAVQLLRGAAAGFTGAGMELYLHATRHRLGALLGGAEGQGLVQAAEAALRAQDVRDPARLVTMHAPGRWGDEG